ncbi:MAG TPA: T9SS type A sorting domain-containing protein [Bacteroidetes bacterium]|nr:T9SS type A sorting domain-containing protein [Bacteroidota bacterium]
MKLKISVLATLFALIALSVSAQFQNPNIENFGPPTEMYLAAPYPAEGTQLIPAGIDLWSGNENNTIHYGLTPPNSSSKPVLVFVHGYGSNATVWFSGRDNMYHDVYQSGYRSVYVSLTPDKHMWTNGAMLATMLTKITQHYGVSKVSVVGWSKGGVDTDAAIVHFGGSSKVSEVFTLSSPHQGTSIAELANSWLLSLVNIIFMQDNDATRSLTRGYMGYFRSLTDNAAGNTVPYTTLGAWGNGPLARLSAPQTIIYGAGGSKASGGNDGVVPYVSSRRPGGRELFSGQRKAYGWFGIPYYPGPSETNLDHYEVTRGLVWPYIKGVFEGTLRVSGPVAQSNVGANTVVMSRSQMVTSTLGSNTFIIDANAENVLLEIPGESTTAFFIRDEKGVNVELTQLEGYVSATRTFLLAKPAAGTYTFVADAPMVALVEMVNGAEAKLFTGLSNGKTAFTADEEMAFRLEFSDLEAGIPADMQVTGILHQTSGLDMGAVDAAPIFLKFRRDGARFFAEASAAIPAGIYGLTVNVRSKSLSRTVTTSLAKLGTKSANEPAQGTSIAIADTWPNPFEGALNLRLDLGEDFTGTLNIYNIYGQLVKQETFVNANGFRELVWEAGALPAGIYIVELRNATEKVSRKVLLK